MESDNMGPTGFVGNHKVLKSCAGLASIRVGLKWLVLLTLPSMPGIATFASPPLQFRNPAVFCIGGPETCPQAGWSPLGLAVADILVPDGYLDVAVCNQGIDSLAGSISLFANAGEGMWGGNPPSNGLVHFSTFDLGPVQGWNLRPYDIEAAELDGQGCPDLIVSVNPTGVATGTRPGVLILFSQACQGFGIGNSNLIFDTQWTQVNGLAVKDLNSDGVKDIAVACSHEQLGVTKPAVTILYGPAGGWTPTSGPAIIQRIQGGIHFPLGTAAQGTSLDVTEIAWCEVQQLGGDLYATMEMTAGPPTNKRALMLANTGGVDPVQGGIQWDVRQVTLFYDTLRITRADFDAGPNTQDWLLWTRDRYEDQGYFDFDVSKEDPIDTCFYGFRAQYPQFVGGYSDPFGVAAKPLDFTVADDAAVCFASGGSRGGAVAITLSQADSLEPLQTTPLYINTVPSGRLAGCKCVRIADLNRDNRNDLVVTNGVDGSLSVLINKTLFPEF